MGALVAACALVAVVLLANGSSYTLRADFQDAGGLVSGDDVLIGPARVGSVTDISLTPNGLARVTMSLSSDAAPMREGTVARIYENSLSGLANKYVVLEPASSTAPAIPDGGLIGQQNTHSQVGLDQVFDAFDAPTRTGLGQVIRGSAASIDGRARQANRTLRYLAPALLSTSNVTAELTRNESEFDGLLVQGASTMQTLATRTAQLSQLVSNTSATTAAIAGQSRALQQALTLLPGALTHSTATFAGLRSTLDTLDPLVRTAIPASRRLPQFAAGLRQLTTFSIPTLASLNALIRNPSGGGDLISLLRDAPPLASAAAAAFPRMIQEMNDSQAQVETFRQYTPDAVAALANVGQIGGYYDANGHYARTQPFFNAFGLNAANELTDRPAFDRAQGLDLAPSRCPGAAVQPAPDGSAPSAVAGCNPDNVPPGP